jgi:ribonuclease HI
MEAEQPIIIYTDGSCDRNPGPGGWAALIREDGKEQVLSGGDADTTNNRMELTAALEALEHLDEGKQIRLYTDSEYLKRGIDEWLPTWRAKNWKRKKGKLANADLWKALDRATQNHDIKWLWVKGHAGNRDNQRVDRLARQAMRAAI